MKSKCFEVLPSVAKNIKVERVSLVEDGLLDLSLERFAAENCSSLRPETDISGLYLTGPDVLTSGFCGRLLAGLLTAGAILERHLFWDLVDLSRAKKAEKFKS